MVDTFIRIRLLENVMPYFRRFRRRRSRLGNIVNSVKKQNSQTSSYAGANANQQFIIATGIQEGTAEGLDTVQVGKVIKSVAVSINMVNSSASAGGDYNVMVWKARKGQSTTNEFGAPNGSSWASIGQSQARNQVILSHMGVLGTEDGHTVTINKNVKIPRPFQRMREGDVLQIIFCGSQGGTLHMGYRYKAYT